MNQTENKALHELTIRSAVYEAISRLLPTLGRDFTVRINVGDDLHHADIIVQGLTPIGKAVEIMLNKELKIKLHEILVEQQKQEEGESNGREESNTGRMSETRRAESSKSTSGGATKSGATRIEGTI